MSTTNCIKAFNNGRQIVRKFAGQGSNVIGFGEMGIGNTSPASALMSIICGLPVDECVGTGAGLNCEGVHNKAKVIQEAIAYSVLKGAVPVLSEMTSFEEAQVINTSLIRMEEKVP